MSEPKKFKQVGPIKFYEPDLWLIPSSLLSIIDALIVILTLGMVMPDLSLRFLMWNLERTANKEQRTN